MRAGERSPPVPPVAEDFHHEPRGALPDAVPPRFGCSEAPQPNSPEHTPGEEGDGNEREPIQKSPTDDVPVDLARGFHRGSFSPQREGAGGKLTGGTIRRRSIGVAPQGSKLAPPLGEFTESGAGRRLTRANSRVSYFLVS